MKANHVTKATSTATSGLKLIDDEMAKERDAAAREQEEGDLYESDQEDLSALLRKLEAMEIPGGRR